MLVLRCSAAGASVRVVSGPVVLQDNIRGQWGGHTFGYLLEGKRGLFWSAAAYEKCDGKWQTRMTVGQYPKPGSDLKAAVTRIPIPNAPYPSAQQKGRDASWRLHNCNQPQMVLTPDGYIHIFVGCDYETDRADISPGRLRYYRSAKPEDITSLVDRTSLIPTSVQDCFHLRMNAGVSPDGMRMALVVLAWSPEQKFGFNTPVVFIGKRSGLDFAFQEPIVYAEPMALFYPQVAATDAGIVVTGQVWDDSKRVSARLIHLSWDGRVLHREDMKWPEDGTYMPLDMRPEDPARNRLLIYCEAISADKTAPCAHDFWRYDVQSRHLVKLRSVSISYSLANSGRMVPASAGGWVFINNPSMGQLYAWDGDLLGDGPVDHQPIAGADPLALGYKASSYLFVPNQLYGSVKTTGEFYIASDCPMPAWTPESYGPYAFLLWRVMTRPE